VVDIEVSYGYHKDNQERGAAMNITDFRKRVEGTLVEAGMLEGTDTFFLSTQIADVALEYAEAFHRRVVDGVQS
jgi:hypothetical protein